jgi:hypothetical protein
MIAIAVIAADGAAAQELAKPPRSLTLADGTVEQANLFDWTDQGPQFRIAPRDRANGAAALPAETTRPGTVDFVQYGTHPAAPRGSCLLLTDGSQIYATITQCNAREWTVATDWFIGTIPTSTIRGWVFYPSLDPIDRDASFRSLLAEQGADDRIALTSGDQASGIVQWPYASASSDQEPATDQPQDDPFARLAWEKDADFKLVITQGDRSVAAAWQEIDSILISPRLHPTLPPESGAWVIGLDGDGSWLEVDRCTATADRKLLLTLACGATIQSRDAIGAAVHQIRYLAPHRHPLSLLASPPLQFKHLPYFGPSQSIEQATRPDDGPTADGFTRQAIVVGDQRHAHGLQMPSLSQATYRVPADAKRLVAQIAVADPPTSIDAPRGGSVVFRVLAQAADRRLQPKYTSPIVRRGEPPISIDVALDGATLLVLVVDYADDGDALDEAYWLDPRWQP